MAEASNDELTDFVEDPARAIPLRKPLGHGKWTDNITVPYSRCSDCEDIGNEQAPVRGKIELYDLVQMAQIIRDNTPIEKGLPELAAAKPYLEIIGCDFHLRRAAEQCFLGTFEYHESGKDALHAFAHPQSLLWIETPVGEIHVMASYPVHPRLAAEARFLEENFKEIAGDYRGKEQ